MKIIDISWPLQESMTFYKDKPSFSKTVLKTVEQQGVAESTLCLGSHVGTHVDAPAHFIAGGATIDAIPLSALCGKAQVIDCTQCEGVITERDLQQSSLQPDTIVLLKTRNSARSATDAFDYNFVCVAADAARYLVTKKIKAIGIDYLGIERNNQPDHPTHTTFMQQSIPIIEGLRLHMVNPGTYFFVGVPLNVVGADAAPARALLFDTMF